jgi:hypothetical protein
MAWLPPPLPPPPPVFVPPAASATVGSTIVLAAKASALAPTMNMFLSKCFFMGVTPSDERCANLDQSIRSHAGALGSESTHAGADGRLPRAPAARFSEFRNLAFERGLRERGVNRIKHRTDGIVARDFRRAERRPATGGLAGALAENDSDCVKNYENADRPMCLIE